MKKLLDYAAVIVLFGGLFLLALLGPARALEIGDSGGPTLMGSGLICDTPEQVVDMIDVAVSANGPVTTIEGCGMLNYPIFMVWKVVGHHVSKAGRIAIVEFTFNSPILGVQYGFRQDPLQGTSA